MSQLLPPGLYIVATPIGNLSDITFRAAEILRAADIIAAEDKRVTAKLLAHIGADTPMRAYHDHSGPKERADLIEAMAEKAVALVSDAGTPLVSDPGYRLVREARAAGRMVTTAPGPSAAIAALTLSGLPTDRFLFAGFLPAKAKARSEAIAGLAEARATLILQERAKRVGAALAALAEGLGAREAAVVREISKRHEEVATGPLGELARRYADAPPRGEIVIVIGPPRKAGPASDAEIDAALEDALRRRSPSRAAAEVAERRGVPRKRAYRRALELK
ncbi:MAG: 16S rRNA (cytidine(1402)-2'-O)-methyltransferase [Sphingomonadaceae bacterium]